MAFPATPLDVRVELFLNNAWTNVTSDVYTAEQIVINRGRADEASQSDPATCALTFNNRSGKYSPRNPTGTYYGVLNRNTPLRVGLGVPPVGTYSSGTTGTAHVAPSVTAEAAGLLIETWVSTGVGNYSIPAGLTAGTEFDGLYGTYGSGYKAVSSGATGTQTATFSTSAAYTAMSVVVPGATFIEAFGSVAINGSQFFVATSARAVGDYLVAIQAWSSDSNDSMHETPADTTGFDADGWVQIADSGAGTGPRIKAFMRRVTRAGVQTVWFRGNFNYYADAVSATTPDIFGRVYVVSGANYTPRFTGEVSTWPTTWDLSGADVRTNVVASGIMRRLSQGSTPVRSAIFRQMSEVPGTVGYWPLEDPEGSKSFASGLNGGHVMTFVQTPVLAAGTPFVASDALPSFTGAGAYGVVPTYTGTGQFTAACLISMPVATADETTFFQVGMGGTSVNIVSLKYEAGATGLRLEVFDTSGTSLLNQVVGPFSPSLTSGPFLLYVTMKNNGANLDWEFGTIGVTVGTTFAGPEQRLTGTLAATQISRVRSFYLGAVNDLTNAPIMGHCWATSAWSSHFTYNLWSALVGYAGEYPWDRAARLASEESVNVATAQFTDTSYRLDVQGANTFLDLMREAEDADIGVLFEPRGMLGLAYRARPAKYNQTALVLDYATGAIFDPFVPVDDDAHVLNDVTVTRTGGTSAREVLTSGALSTQAPPNGVGKYDTEISISASSDNYLPDQASWRLHVGTIDAARFPSVSLDLAGSKFSASATLTAAVRDLTIGDLISVTNPPAWIPPDAIDLTIEGYTEVLAPFSHEFVFNCSTGLAWKTGVYNQSGNTASRYSSDGSTLAATMTTGATSMSVATPSGPLWSAADQPFDLIVAGERMTVTAVTGSSSPQTFTVTRSVNGVVKTHAVGETVALFSPAYYAL